MYLIWKEMEFSSAHAIRGHTGGCENIHGHNYRVRVWVESDNLDKLGMVMDFKELKMLMKEIVKTIDHQNLNTIPPFDTVNSTAELLAKFFFDELEKKLKTKPVRVRKVEIFETPTSCAIYSKP